MSLPYLDRFDSERQSRLDNLVARKAFKICINGVWQDFVDLFIFLRWRLYTMDQIIRLSEKKFEGEFNAKLFLQQLVYFDDVKTTQTDFFKKSYTPEEIKSFLESEVANYLKKILPV